MICDDEYVINWSWCNKCFNDDYTEYMESVAGPFEWLPCFCVTIEEGWRPFPPSLCEVHAH